MEGWENIKENMSPTEQTSIFEKILQEKLDLFCPEKTMKVSSQDKPWINAELKTLSRQKSREYNKRGKSAKYRKLFKKFEEKFKIEAEKYLRKNMDALMENKPGQAYSILKKMGAQPGDCIDNNTFTLPGHEIENLSAEESAERIAAHFAAISQEFPPLDPSSLPQHVQEVLNKDTIPPAISEYDAYCKIVAAKKPRSSVPGDIPRELIQEFAPELSTPVSRIITSIVQSGQWPTQWKMEYISAIGKVPHPET
jgi:5'-deoxynucleotidase YfbR-like HD superfamily hydrolase